MSRRLGRPGNGSTLWHRGAAFTLIELLVVISIISILMGLALVGINAARDHGDASAVATEIHMIKAGINAFRDAMGDYPPTRLEDIDKKLAGNGLNDGNESLFAFLLSQRKGGPHAEDLLEERWTNVDVDSASPAQLKIIKTEINWVRGNAKLLEYTDLWGNPYIYIHNRDYETKFKYQRDDGTTFVVEARKNAQTGTYNAPTSYQLWSIGVNGQNENGDGDDIPSWR